MTWYQVESYCLWAGKELCTEAQWEKGARGGCEHNGGTSNCKAQSRKYPWGNQAATCDLAVSAGCPGDTQAVCSLSPAGDSPYGLCDMAGNLREWVADWYQKDYYYNNNSATGDEYCTECGSWPDSPSAWNNPYCNIIGSARAGSYAGAASTSASSAPSACRVAPATIRRAATATTAAAVAGPNSVALFGALVPLSYCSPVPLIGAVAGVEGG